MPSASPIASAQDLVRSLLELAEAFVLPDWKGLVDLFPVLLAILFVAWFAFTLRGFATLGPSRRAPARIQPITPPSVHMPGGSMAPILAALGSMGLFAGLVFGGLILWIGVTLLVLTLLWWLREGMRDYQQVEPQQTLPAVVHEGPPPGVHMPGPSIRPLLGALGAAVLFGGLVIGGWVLVAAAIFFAWTLIGWLTDFKAEYRKVEEADRSGHLENIPARKFPKRTLLVAGIALALVTAGQLGFLTPATAGDGEGSPPPDGGGGPTAPPGAQTVVARGIAFDVKTLEVAAGEAFTLFMINEDPPNTPHDIDIRSQDGATLQDQREIPGGEAVAYTYEPLDAGEYVFICSIHPIPAMTGTLTVQ